MSHDNIQNLRPFVSLVSIICMLFVFVFAKMELRRMGYFALKLSKQERELRDLKRAQQIQLAQYTRPERIHRLAYRDGKTATAGQIIQISGERLALRQ
jgi:hypothetical protein